MGVPAFFRWLSRKYPSIVVHCEEEKPKIINGQKIPVDSSKPNTNNVEFDNLYLDMNGIIHPCCHPENKPAPKNEDEMMVLIFEYIDRIFSICRPRKLLYMAIDGVAPRAKMNQQRSRRFRASKEVEEKADAIKEIRESLESRGLDVPKEKPKEEHFDSNCITPGTPFMDRLAKCLHYYIHDRLNSDPGWRNIEIILSDANVPGEGEHKIMDFIRKQRANPDHDPNTHHCLCGADADLIMLGLATHEPNFTIIREEFKPNQPRPCDLCGQLGHELKDCEGAPKEKLGEFDELEKPMAAETDFIFIRLCVLREYLERDLAMPNLPFPYDFERCIDDWVFMCFFVGNDFLPHLPSLEIREGAIDRLVNLYKKTVYRTGGYLTNSGLVNLSRVQLIMTDLGEVEDEIFKRRQQNEINFKQRNKDKKKRMKLEKMAEKPAWTPGGQFAPRDVRDGAAPVVNVREEAYQMRKQGMQHRGNLDAADALRAMLRDGKGDGKPSQNSDKEKGDKRKSDQIDSDSEEEPPDEVRLWEDGFKERYYESKFEVDANNFEFRHKVAAAYVLGLCWVLRYYYQGCASWKWFFPYHYAPFASDFINIGDLNCDFETGTVPFNPMEQLMGVFPAASKQHLPPAFGDLMDDPDSPIIDFYPTDFKIDLNGKKFAWQGVALLPFVDERRLLNALKDVYPSLTLDEKRRNTRGSDRLYVRKSHTGYDFLLGLYENNSNKSQMFDLITKYFNGMAGVVLLSSEVVGPGDMLESPVTGLDPLYENATVCVKYEDPKYKEGFIFPAVRLPGAKDPVKVIKPGEYTPRNFGSNHGGNNYNNNWRPQIGMAPATQRASLDISGFRKLDRGLNPYNEIAPPMNAYGRNTGYNANPQMFQTQRSYDFGGYQQYGRAPVAPSDLYYQGNPNSNPQRWGQQNRQAQSHSGNQGTHQQNYRGGNQSRDSRQDSSRPGGHHGHQGHQSGQRGGYQSGAGRGNYQQQSHYQSRR